MTHLPWRGLVLACVLAFVSLWAEPVAYADEACRRQCAEPAVGFGSGVVNAAYVVVESGSWVASNSPPSPQPYVWRLVSPCSTLVSLDCGPDQAAECPAPPGRVVQFVSVQRR